MPIETPLHAAIWPAKALTFDTDKNIPERIRTPTIPDAPKPIPKIFWTTVSTPITISSHVGRVSRRDDIDLDTPLQASYCRPYSRPHLCLCLLSSVVTQALWQVSFDPSLCRENFLVCNRFYQVLQHGEHHANELSAFHNVIYLSKKEHIILETL